MCLAIPGQVLALDPAGGDLATVEVVGVKRPVNIALLQAEGVRPGDWVLIHVGFAMTRIDEAEAHATLEALRAMGQIWDEELDALRAVDRDAGG